MSLVVTLENLRGLGAVGDRVARVIFRGKCYGAWTWNETNCYVIFIKDAFKISLNEMEGKIPKLNPTKSGRKLEKYKTIVWFYW